jgi:hypothetical protein
VEVDMMFRRILSIAAWLVVLGVAGYQLGFKQWRERWQAKPDESVRDMPGDDLVPDAEFKQTMALTIDAPPKAVWPWLVQMGYGRGGWYSYDSIDMLGNSSRELRPELQELHVGQMLPVGPGIGFRVEVIEPDHALVLYGDQELFEHAQWDTGGAAEETPGLKFVDVLSRANMSDFAVSWSFILEPIDGGRTRLLERFRARRTPGPAAAIVGPLIDVGHFLMTRRQMLGLRERVEEFDGEISEAPPEEVIAAIA